MTCHELVKLLRAERDDLTEEIIKHKYYLSQREHKDVGYKAAEMDFIDNYLPIWAEGYKRAFCSLVCHDKECKNRQ